RTCARRAVAHSIICVGALVRARRSAAGDDAVVATGSQTREEAAVSSGDRVETAKGAAALRCDALLPPSPAVLHRCYDSVARVANPLVVVRHEAGRRTIGAPLRVRMRTRREVIDAVVRDVTPQVAQAVTVEVEVTTALIPQFCLVGGLGQITDHQRRLTADRTPLVQENDVVSVQPLCLRHDVARLETGRETDVRAETERNLLAGHPLRV